MNIALIIMRSQCTDHLSQHQFSHSLTKNLSADQNVPSGTQPYHMDQNIPPTNPKQESLI
jgi:hypothetical protein